MQHFKLKIHMPGMYVEYKFLGGSLPRNNIDNDSRDTPGIYVEPFSI